MPKKPLDELSVKELQQLLYLKKRARRRARWQRLKSQGRVVDVAHLASPKGSPPPLARPHARPTGALARYTLQAERAEVKAAESTLARLFRRDIAYWRRFANRLLLVVEVLAFAGFLAAVAVFWQAMSELNRDANRSADVVIAALSAPTPSPTPIIGAVVLPSGHRPPQSGRPPQPGEAGGVPDHLLPLIEAYEPPPAPTPGAEQARRIQIPSLDLDKPIVQGDDWDALKKGVGQHIGSAQPGQTGNLVLSAHNDIYGKIFRHLDQLEPGDEIIIHTERRSYTYVVRELQIVQPTDVWVMAPTDYPSATLISCYPYLVNNKRIVVFADLVTQGT